MAAAGDLNRQTFADSLLDVVPEVEPEVRDHLDVNGELLLHLLMPDLLAAAVRFFHDGDLELEQRLLGFVDRALRDGNDYVETAVAVSLVEGVGAFPGESPDFVASWPAGLTAELQRFRNASSPAGPD